MKISLNDYRFAGIAGGLLLAAGQFLGYLCVLQLAALVPVMVLVLRDRPLDNARDRRPRWAALAGLYMGIAYTIPQMIYLRMPVPVTAALLVWMTLLLIVLCMAIAVFLPRHSVLGPLAVGAAWTILDWINYTAVPVWGMAQSFGRSWTAYPFAIQFISLTGISGVLFVVGILQGLIAYFVMFRSKFNPLPPSGYFPLAGGELMFVLVVLFVFCIDAAIWFQKPTGSLRIAAAGWVFDDTGGQLNPNTPEGFQKLFAEPAKKAAENGARIFTTGELGFYIADHERPERIEQFAQVARDNDLWLVVGYFRISRKGADENRIFFMSPEGRIVHEYTKTHLTPFEPGRKGSGDLQTIEVDDLTVGAMICQDDNFSKLTRCYGNLKADIVLCPTADWWTIKNAHLQAVRARTIECGYGIVRGAANGISAAITPRGQMLQQYDHYKDGPGYIIADIPVYRHKTWYSQLGNWPSLIAAFLIVAAVLFRKESSKSFHFV